MKNTKSIDPFREVRKAPRLGDRAFQIVKNEIERRYSDCPNDQIERVILLARLETLRANKGRPVSRVQIWEVLSDVAPNFDQNVLMDAEIVETDSPMMGVSIGVGAVAALVAAAIGMDSVTTAGAVTAKQPAFGPSDVAPQPVASENNRPQSEPVVTVEQTGETSRWPRWLMKRSDARRESTEPLFVTGFGAFEKAKGLGWQAALKSQDPPYSAQHWAETADLWRLAIAHLDQVSPQHESYTPALSKKTVYQQNLQEIQKRQKEAERRDQIAITATPKSTQAASPTAEQVPQFANAPSENSLKVARNYGWQAALASQNAPHPPEKWADISRLWQAALLNLESIDSDQSNHAEAQQVKAQYQDNLAAVRGRYQKEQAATQTLQSLRATLTELDHDTAPNVTQYGQLESIVEKLRSIPTGTEAHFQAQKLAAETAGVMDAIAANPNSQVTLSPRN